MNLYNKAQLDYRENCKKKIMRHMEISKGVCCHALQSSLQFCCRHALYHLGCPPILFYWWLLYYIDRVACFTALHFTRLSLSPIDSYHISSISYKYHFQRRILITPLSHLQGYHTALSACLLPVCRRGSTYSVLSFSILRHQLLLQISIRIRTAASFHGRTPTKLPPFLSSLQLFHSLLRVTIMQLQRVATT